MKMDKLLHTVFFLVKNDFVYILIEQKFINRQIKEVENIRSRY